MKAADNFFQCPYCSKTNVLGSIHKIKQGTVYCKYCGVSSSITRKQCRGSKSQNPEYEITTILVYSL